MTTSSTELRRFWRAVLLRDEGMDDAFVYAVRSTGIFCRPTCPSRRPHRSQVLFFRTAREAREGGFRACRRCWARPERERADAAFVTTLCRMLERDGSHETRGDAVQLVAAQAGVSVGKVRRVFERMMGVTPAGYADQFRWGCFKRQMRQEVDVTTAMVESGYGSSSRLYERANVRLGMTPATYGRGGRGMEIRYTIAPSPVGRILVAGTERGISAVYMGRSDAELVATLKREYPEARISRNPASVSRWLRVILRHLAGRQPALDLPLDIQGTAFQRRVWQALQQIPYGETRSYTEVARQLGSPKARRAVARACATNPVSLVVPCHRVVRSDGGLGGYAGGIERKVALLAEEKRSAKKRSRTD